MSSFAVYPLYGHYKRTSSDKPTEIWFEAWVVYASGRIAQPYGVRTATKDEGKEIEYLEVWYSDRQEAVNHFGRLVAQDLIANNAFKGGEEDEQGKEHPADH